MIIFATGSVTDARVFGSPRYGAFAKSPFIMNSRAGIREGNSRRLIILEGEENDQ